ncbi:MAG: hypothetical protein P0107_04245 [Nitrosomonas sp.]|nr:hypothetical protein [Nitrosomonas sp.]
MRKRWWKAVWINSRAPGEFGIIIGQERARSLNAFPGNKIVLISPQGQITPAGMPPSAQFTVTGIFDVGHFEHDSGLALIHRQDAQKLYRMAPNQVSGIRSNYTICSKLR